MPVKNYRDLSRETQTPRLLVVLHLPANEQRWMTVTAKKLVMRRRAYWISLQREHRPPQGQHTVTVHIPRCNVLDVETLQDLMERSRDGGHLMRVVIHDRDALLAVSPTALSAYARASGWQRQEPYRTHSDIYVHKGQPEIIVPRSEHLADYASAVADLIKTFAQVEDHDEISVYRSLVTADRDVIRVRTGDSQGGSVRLADGLNLIGGVRDMLLAAACSLGQPKPVYRTGANRNADLVDGIRLAHTDQGSFVVTLFTPVVPPPIPALLPDVVDGDAPIVRRLTVRLMEALVAARRASERVAAGEGSAFGEAVESGVSTNLCEALDQIIRCSPKLDVSVAWAATRPRTEGQRAVRFGRSDGPLMREAARSFRERAPRPDMVLQGYVRVLTRPEDQEDGKIQLRSFVEQDGSRQQRSITASLAQEDYERAVQAHRDRALVVLSGDLERIGQRWRLLNPHLEGILGDDESGPDE